LGREVSIWGIENIWGGWERIGEKGLGDGFVNILIGNDMKLFKGR
jgi:hypothetical protein